MQPVTRSSLSERTASHLRDGFQSGRWQGALPGVRQLASELGVSRDVLRDALRLLENSGEVLHGGAGRHRLIAASTKVGVKSALRVGILLSCPLEQDNAHTHQLIFGIRQAVESMGHVCFLAPKSASALRQSPARIREHMLKCRADAWIVYSAERSVLEMAAELAVPVFALGGMFEDLPLAGSVTDLRPPLHSAVSLLAALGHRQIVLICPLSWRHPHLNQRSQTFLQSLRQHGIKAEPHYNVPDWAHTPAGLHDLLEALFTTTPPTALLVMEPECVGPILVFLAEHGLRVPEDVSLINLLPDPMQSFYRVALAHFEWPITKHIRNIICWLRHLAKGRRSLAKATVPPGFVRGESIAKRMNRTKTVELTH